MDFEGWALAGFSREKCDSCRIVEYWDVTCTLSYSLILFVDLYSCNSWMRHGFFLGHVCFEGMKVMYHYRWCEWEWCECVKKNEHVNQKAIQGWSLSVMCVKVNAVVSVWTNEHEN
jgi:hypothetical protein